MRAVASPASAMVHTKDHGSVRAEVADLFRSALNTAYPNAGIEPVVAACNNAKNGDYQCNNAMALFGKLKGTENAPKAPRDVANAILAALPANDLISETSLAGPGFINIRLNKDALARRVGSMLTDGLAKFAPEGHAGKKVGATAVVWLRAAAGLCSSASPGLLDDSAIAQ